MADAAPLIPIPNAPLGPGTLQRVLSGHAAFAAWSDEQLAALAGHCRLLEADAGATVLAQGAVDPFVCFLLDGALLLRDANGAERQVATGTAEQRFPIARLRPALFDVVAERASRLLLVEQSVLSRLSRQGFTPTRRVRFDLFAPPVAGSWQEHPLVTDLQRAMDGQTLTLPVIPAIALKVRRALAKDDFQLKEIARILAADPVISAKLLKVANSSAFAGQTSCDSLQSAVVRLGVDRIRNLVLALSSSLLFTATEPFLRARLAAVWRHLLSVGAFTAVLAKHSGRLNADLGLLVGLLHEIGKLPILHGAARYPEFQDNPGLLEDILAALGPAVSRATLEQWGIAEPAVLAAERQHQWSYEHDGEVDYSDLLLVAHVYAEPSSSALVMPPLTEMPAFSRITGNRLSAQESLGILREAVTESRLLKQLLSG